MNRPPIRPAMSRDEVRAVDRVAIERFHIPGIVLMENAGRGAAELLDSLGIDGPIGICCGKGNNGGDGFVIARHLANRGYDVRVFLFCDPQDLTGDAEINYRIVEASGLAPKVLTDPDEAGVAGALANCDWIIDALLGTGTRGSVREPFPAVIEAINHSPGRVLAVDLPSGLDCDTGEPLGCCVRADQTATFVAPKLGFEKEPSREYCGTVHVIDIGVPEAVLKEAAAEDS